MDSFKITFVCLLVSPPAITGLSCLKCEDYFFDTDNQAVKNMFRRIGMTENRACLAPVDNNKITVPVEECPKATSGKVSMCVFANGSGTGLGGGQSIRFTFTQRACGSILESKKDTCEEFRWPKLPPNVTKAEGSLCYCSTDRCNRQTRPIPAVTRLSCLKCQDFFFDTDNQAAKNMFRRIGMIETPACREPVDNKTTTLPLEECPEATNGEVSTCVIAKGSGTGLGGGQIIEFTFTQRSCGSILENKTDTCEEIGRVRLPPNITKIDGNVCYCSTDKCNRQTRLVPAAAVFFLNLVTICFLKE